jgi:hypothetical protein
VERILSKGGAAGKRLDFLMQELNREANTLASKSVAAGPHRDGTQAADRTDARAGAKFRVKNHDDSGTLTIPTKARIDGLFLYLAIAHGIRKAHNIRVPNRAPMGTQHG